MPKAILRLPTVIARTGTSRTAHYTLIHQGLMTRPVSLGPLTRGWPEDEIDALIAARIAGKSDAEIRYLVLVLEKNRQDAFAGVDEARSKLEGGRK